MILFKIDLVFYKRLLRCFVSLDLKIGGLILGKHEKYNDFETNRKPHKILLEVLGVFNFPILADVDCYHTNPMMTFPIGCRVKLDAAEQKITLLENPIKKWRNSKNE